MKEQRTPRRGIGVLVVAFLLLAVFFGARLFKKFDEARTPPPAPVATQQAGLLTVTLFFAVADGDGLAREGREIESCNELSGCLEAILEELINGPLTDLSPVLPLTGMFNSVKLDGNVARVDFAQELIDGLPSGSSSELAAVYAVANSFCFNFPQIQQVQFTVDGKPLETLKGHLDLRRPISPDFSLEKGAVQLQDIKGNKQ
jgi:spore germination protein GerM